MKMACASLRFEIFWLSTCVICGSPWSTTRRWLLRCWSHRLSLLMVESQGDVPFVFWSFEVGWYFLESSSRSRSWSKNTTSQRASHKICDASDLIVNRWVCCVNVKFCSFCFVDLWVCVCMCVCVFACGCVLLLFSSATRWITNLRKT